MPPLRLIQTGLRCGAMANDDSAKIAKQLDGLTPHQIVDEIRQIAEQFRAEMIPGARMSWPESIRVRVLALVRLGITGKKISELTGIPKATVFLWGKHVPTRRRRWHDPHTAGTTLPATTSSRFIELPSDEPRTVVRLDSKRSLKATAASSAICLRTPQGFEFSGLARLADAVALFRELSR